MSGENENNQSGDSELGKEKRMKLASEDGDEKQSVVEKSIEVITDRDNQIESSQGEGEKIQATSSTALATRAGTPTASKMEILAKDHVFVRDSLLSKILDFLSTKELKLCRCVSKRWECIVPEIFEKRNNLQLCINFSPDGNQLLDVESYKMNIVHNNATITKTLVELNHYLDTANPSKFPCSTFLFLGGTLEEAELRYFLLTHGYRIKKLCLDIDSEFPSRKYYSLTIPTMQTLKNVLKNQAPNVEYLRLRDLPHAWHVVPETSQTFLSKDGTRFPSLKILELEASTPSWFFEQFVRAGTHLEDLRFENGSLQYYIDFTCLHLLKVLYIVLPKMVDVNSYLKTLEKISNNKIVKLKELHMTGMFKVLPERSIRERIGKVISNLIKNNRGTLEHITWQLPDFLDGPLAEMQRNSNGKIDFNLPQLKVLKVVEKLENTDSTDTAPKTETIRIFPNSFRFIPYRVFSNLKKVVLLGLRYPKKEFTEVPSLSLRKTKFRPLLTVTQLSLIIGKHAPPSMKEMEDVVRLFPNVCDAKFENLRQLEPGTQGIWKFEKLKKLKLSFNVGDALARGQVSYSVDTFFTGISQANCKDLSYRRLGKEDDLERAHKFREYPSILDVDDLVHLEILFFDDTGSMGQGKPMDKDFELPERMPLTISDITGRFALALCPKLRTEVVVQAEGPQRVEKWKQYLTVLEPFANNGPWKGN